MKLIQVFNFISFIFIVSCAIIQQTPSPQEKGVIAKDEESFKGISASTQNGLIIKLFPILIKIFITIMKVANAAFPELSKLFTELLKGFDKIKTSNEKYNFNLDPSIGTLMDTFVQMNGINSTIPSSTSTNLSKLAESDFMKILIANLPLIISIIMKILNVASDQVGEIVKAVIEALGIQTNLDLLLMNFEDDVIAQTLHHLK